MAVGIGMRPSFVTRYQLGSRIGQSATAAFSLRLINPSYSGHLVRVRRDSDNDEMDIYPLGNELDTASLASFCSGANGFVTELKDQSGNLCCATQATPDNQPKIYDATTGIVLENGKPALSFDGVDDKMAFDNTAVVGSSYGIFAVVKQNTTNEDNYIFGGGSTGTDNNLHFGWRADNKLNLGHYGDDLTVTNDSIVQSMLSGHLDLVSKARSTYVNGVLLGSDTATSALIGNAGSAIGLFGPSSYFSNMIIQELIIYAADKLASRTAIESDINTHYAIY